MRLGASVRQPTPHDPGAVLHYSPWMSAPATLVMWFQLRSPQLAEDFERLMAGDRDIVRGSLDTVSDWRLTRPTDVPGQSDRSSRLRADRGDRRGGPL